MGKNYPQLGNYSFNNSLMNSQLNASSFNYTSAFNYSGFVSPSSQRPQPLAPSRPKLPTTLVAVPLPRGSCCSCNAELTKNLSRSTIQIPVQVNPPPGTRTLVNEPFCTPAPPPLLSRLRRVGENPLLVPPLTYLPTPPMFQYVPPPQKSGNEVKPRRPEEKETQRLKCHVGPNKWYNTRCQNQLQTTAISKNRSGRVQKQLKRLQNRSMMRHYKAEKRRNYEEMESIRESKLEMLRRKGIKGPEKTECPLWNCPRKELKRRGPFMLHRRCRSVSSLSNLSEKSRSPIIFRRVP